MLVRFREKNWLLIKMKDEYANSGDVVKKEVRSIKTNRTMDEIKKDCEK